jgi:hypothetical protein
MMARVHQWFLGYRSWYPLLIGTHVFHARDNFSVCSELSLIMMGAGVVGSALPQPITVESDSPSQRVPRELRRLAKSRRRWAVSSLLLKRSEPRAP